jgi:hypothetical protein
MNEKHVRQLVWVNLLATVGLFACLFYYAVLSKRAIEWNRDLQDRLERVEQRLRSVEKQ